MGRLLWLMPLAYLGGCATIVEGSDQTLRVSTDPAGAECELRRNGEVIAVVDQTPGSVTVDKSQYEITVSCQLDGYEEAVGTVEPEFEDMTVGNILLGGVIGIGVDAASGAMHEYRPNVTVVLHEVEETVEEAEEAQLEEAQLEQGDEATQVE